MQLQGTIAGQEGFAAAETGTAEPAFGALVATFALLKRVMEPYFARYGVSGTQWGVLRTLHGLEGRGQPEPRLTDLGHQLLVRPPSITGAVDRLQRLGLVHRSASSTDQRAKHVRLTPAGRALVDRVLEHHREQLERVLGGLAPPEQIQLQSLLSRLESHLQPMAERIEVPAATATIAAAGSTVAHVTDGNDDDNDDDNGHDINGRPRNGGFGDVGSHHDDDEGPGDVGGNGIPQ
jgi:DNA-binding MarR family transcriptional regulator